MHAWICDKYLLALFTYIYILVSDLSSYSYNIQFIQGPSRHALLPPLTIKNWKHSKNGSLSRSGTTASISIIRAIGMYLANIDNTTMVVGKLPEPNTATNSSCVVAQIVTQDHKPEDPAERERIENIGGCVIMSPGGTMRVACWESRWTVMD